MIAKISNRIELTFWNWAIPTLSNNQRLHWVIKQIQTVTKEHDFRWYALRAGLAGAAGLLCGFSGYFLFVH